MPVFLCLEGLEAESNLHRFDGLATRVRTHAVRPAGVNKRPSVCESILPGAPKKTRTGLMPVFLCLAGLEAESNLHRFDGLATRVRTRAARPAGVSKRPSVCESIRPGAPKKTRTGLMPVFLCLESSEAESNLPWFDGLATRVRTRAARPAGVSKRPSVCESILPGAPESFSQLKQLRGFPHAAFALLIRRCARKYANHSTSSGHVAGVLRQMLRRQMRVALNHREAGPGVPQVVPSK